MLITKQDLFHSAWDYEKAYSRIDKHWGNYLYQSLCVPFINDIENVYFNHKKEIWISEFKREANQKEITAYSLGYITRGSLEDYINAIK